ncbi:MAG: hypothetical protein ACYC61_01440 [Isosphaeraceae bacterium]
MNGNEARGLVPPKPNLGPEPWRDVRPGSRLLLPAVLVVIAVVFLMLAWAWRRRRAALLARRTFADLTMAAEPTPRDRLVGLSDSIRDALTVPFGTSGRAKTTEELASDERLAGLLGDEDFRELIRFLDRIDVLKFAPERGDNGQNALEEMLSNWEPRITALDTRIRARPRARGRGSNGIAPAPAERANGAVQPIRMRGV